MSEVAVSQFFEKLQKDKALAGHYNTAVSNAILPAMVAVAAQHGFEFTAQELSRYLKKESHELSEQELENISAAGPLGPLSALTNPWVIGGLVAAAIAVPVAINDDEDPGS